MSTGFKLNIVREDVAKGGTGASFIGTSGLYEVTVLAVTVDQNDNGAVSLGFYVDLGNDNKQMLYGALPMATYDNKTDLEGNRKLFGAFCEIAGVDMETDFQPIDVTLPIGKAGAMKEIAIFEEFEDVPVKIWIKQDYYAKGDGTIGDSRTIKGFFRAADNASGDEIINSNDGKEVVFGTRYEKQSKYFEDVSYKDVTEDQVKAMIDSRKDGGSSKSTAPASTAKRSRFAK